jgi:hypothetical protein
MVEKYVEYNEDDLVKLFTGEMGIDDYIGHMVAVNDRGEAVNPQAKQVWFHYKPAGYGYDIVFNTYHEGKFNYQNRNGEIMIKDKLFDECSGIIEINGKLLCSAYLGDTCYSYAIKDHKFELISKGPRYQD